MLRQYHYHKLRSLGSGSVDAMFVAVQRPAQGAVTCTENLWTLETSLHCPLEASLDGQALVIASSVCLVNCPIIPNIRFRRARVCIAGLQPTVGGLDLSWRP